MWPAEMTRRRRGRSGRTRPAPPAVTARTPPAASPTNVDRHQRRAPPAPARNASIQRSATSRPSDCAMRNAGSVSVSTQSGAVETVAHDRSPTSCASRPRAARPDSANATSGSVVRRRQRGCAAALPSPACGARRRLLHRHDHQHSASERSPAASAATDGSTAGISEPARQRAEQRRQQEPDAPDAVAGVHDPRAGRRLDPVGLDIDRDIGQRRTPRHRATNSANSAHADGAIAHQRRRRAPSPECRASGRRRVPDRSITRLANRNIVMRRRAAGRAAPARARPRRGRARAGYRECARRVAPLASAWRRTISDDARARRQRAPAHGAGSPGSIRCGRGRRRAAPA